MSRHVRIRMLVAAAMVMVAAAVWLTGDRQRAAADVSFAQIEAAHQMLLTMLDQEAGFNSYITGHRAGALKRYEQGRRAFEVALERSEQSQREPEERAALALQRDAARRWQTAAGEHLSHVVAGRESGLPRSEAAGLERRIAGFRDANAGLRRHLEAERIRNQGRAVDLTVALIIVLSVAFALVVYFAFDRRVRRQDHRSRAHELFTNALQLARSETEAFAVVRRYLERLVPGGRATILNRNNSANHLEARTPVEDPALLQMLDGAEPESCLAIRGGRAHRRVGTGEDLIGCEICGAVGENVTCVPSLVGGEVIGSVLISHPGPLGPDDAEALSSSLAEAAPIVANLRNLAIAELRAATDSLTGLPKNRSVHETLKRMAAQTGRTASPLTAVLFDLDHFKEINDTHGHGKGDEVLAAVGDAVATTVRESDFVGRYGGEEFLALLPDTGREGGLAVAENLRRALATVTVAGVSRKVSASFGVAVLPDDAVEPEELLRVADRALYTAKRDGRDRVETAAPRVVRDGAVA